MPKKKFKWNRAATQREIVVWAVVLCLVIFLGAKRFFVPITQEIRNAKALAEAKKVELETYRKMSKKSVPQAGGGNLGRQLIVQKVRDLFTKNNMAPDVIVSELLTELTKPEYVKAALLEKYNFTGEKKQNGYSEMGLDLKWVGTYDGIADYLNAIRDLPYLLKIETVDLKPQDPTNPFKVELIAKAVLYVGDPKVAQLMQTEIRRSDIAADLLFEGTGAEKPMRTPFAVKPREMSAWSLHELKLTSTMAGSQRPTALINGKIFELGQEVAEFKLVEIRPREVVLERGEIRFVLKIQEALGKGGEEGEPSIFSSKPESQPSVNPEAPKSETPPAAVEKLPDSSGTEASPEPSPEDPAAENDEEEKGPSASPSSGSGGGGGAYAQGPANGEISPEEWARYKANEYGILTPPPEQEGKRKLNPNEVEDVEGVPFEDLETPWELLAGVN